MTRRALLVFALLLAAPALAQDPAQKAPTQKAKPAAKKPAAKAKANTRPAWAELTAEQQMILAPLKDEWDSLEPERRRKAIAFQETIDERFNLGGTRQDGEHDAVPISIAREARKLAGFTDEEIERLIKSTQRSQVY